MLDVLKVRGKKQQSVHSLKDVCQVSEDNVSFSLKALVDSSLTEFPSTVSKELIFASIYNGKSVHCKSDDVPFSLKAFVDSLVKEYSPLAESKGLIFAGIYNGEDITVFGHYKGVKEIVNHLLANAIECTSTGYVVLNIEYVNGKLVIYVADSRADIKMKYGNTEWPERIGSDLTDTLELIHHLKGTIQVISDDGKGCKFIIHLPMSVYKG